MNNTLCKICSGHTKTIYSDEVKSAYFKCLSCDFIFIDSKHLLARDVEKSKYDFHKNSIDNPGYVKMFEQFISKVYQPYSSEIHTALDFGCGPGPVLAELLIRKNIEVDIYDPYYFPNSDFDSKQYDLIVSTEVFEHLLNPLEEIKKLKNSIREGGYLGIMTLFQPDEVDFPKWWYIRDDTHISFYSNKTFEVISDILGFEIISSDNYNTILLKKV